MQKETKVALHNDARRHIISGVKSIYDPVRLTLGHEGGNALLYRTFGRGTRITNDGKTIAGTIEPKNEFQAIVAQTFREACERTDVEAGDGTTSTTVVGGHLIISSLEKALENSEGFVQSNKHGVISMKNELLAAGKQVVEEIKKSAKKIETKEELEKIATVSVESKELGKIIADMVWEVGEYGSVDVVEGFKGEIETEVVKGMRFPAKVAGKAFINNAARSEMVMEDVPTLITNHHLDSVNDAGTLIGGLLQTLSPKKIAILSPSFSEQVLVEIFKTCFKRNNDGTYLPTGIEIYPVHVPSLRTEQFQDIAAYTGSVFIDKNEGMKLSSVTEKDLGFLSKLIVKDVDAREDAVATGGKGQETNAVKDRIKELEARLKEGFKIETHRKLTEKRIASLAASVGIIRVGAQSQAESRYMKLKIEDAAYAAKAAMQEGYVEGGGMCLKKIAEKLPESLLTESLKQPYRQICENAEEEVKVGKNIIDPAKVVRLTVENAVSVASHLITVKAIVPEAKDVTPGDGYKEIAKALNVSNRLQAKKDKIEIERIRAEEMAYESHVDDVILNDED